MRLDLTHFTPSTLAAMAADLGNSDMNMTSDQREMYTVILRELFANCGGAEASMLVASAGGELPTCAICGELCSEFASDGECVLEDCDDANGAGAPEIETEVNRGSIKT